MKTLLRVSTAGNVDDGKSTLIGRLLFETNSVPVDVIETVRKSSKDFPGGIDFSLITDGLSSEQEQKITIDVAYRYFSSAKRQFILADTPGHIQYTRNMATGASTADVAIVLIDAAKGVANQSRRHAVISSLLGIRHLIVAVNKMDLVDFKEGRFNQIREEFSAFAGRLNIQDIRYVPVSALYGDNVVATSRNMAWYTGETLQKVLDSLHTESDNNLVDFRMAVQRVIIAAGCRYYAGRISSGAIHVGDTVVVLPAGLEASVTQINSPKGAVRAAECGQSITLTLDREIDVARGDVLVPVNNISMVDSDFDATLVWMDEESLDPNKVFWLKHGTAWVRARVESIGYKLDVDTLRKDEISDLNLNEIARVSIHTFRPLAFDPYYRNRETGSFVLVDPTTLKTSACGLILDKQARSKKLSRDERKTLLFTGRPGAGKSTIAEKVYRSLKLSGIPATWLDGEQLRGGLSRDLDFSVDGRRENLRRMAEVAKLFNQEGLHVVGSFIAPSKNDRELIRTIVGDGAFLEIFVDAPLEVCIERDLKGLYKNSLGNADSSSAHDLPYEPPSKPQLTLRTDKSSIDECVDRVLKLLLRT